MSVKSILVVEDSALTALLIEALLSKAGLCVTLAVDAERALETLKNLTPDLILTDVQLPGLSGLELTRLLKADPTRCNIPVVALTANDSPEDQQDTMAAGCDHFVPKPINPAQFAALICSFVPGQPGQLLPASGAVPDRFETLLKKFLVEGVRDSDLMLGELEHGANNLGFIRTTLHSWIGCACSAGIPEIGDRAQRMRELISCHRLDLAALTGEAQALRNLFEGALASHA